MNREELKALGLTDEQIETVMKSHGKATNDLKTKADSVDGLESQIEDYKGQITERDAQLETLSKVDAEGLQAEIDRLKGENEETATEFQGKLDQQAFDFTLERSLVGAKVRNPKAVKALLDTESIKLDGETLLGLDDQLTALKESDAYLFGEDKPPGIRGRNPHVTDDSGTPPANNPFSKDHFNLTEQGRLLRDDPELYKQLKANAK